MTLKEAALKQPPSQEQPGLQSPTANKPEGDVSEETEGPILEGGGLVNSDASAVISDEILRHRIHTLIEEKPKASSLQSFLMHPLVIALIVAVVSFLLTGIVGGLLTYYYTLKQKDLDYQRAIQQQELASRRSFLDELNKIRTQKIGEVWEQLDKTEPDIDELLDRINKSPDSNNETTFENIQKLINDDMAVVNKNRFWLGDQSYNRVEDYLDISRQYAIDKITGRPGIDLSATVRRREQAKQDILQTRRMLLNGEPGP